jgi:hypothetical protein
MATENPLHIITKEAGTNVTNKRFVVYAADNKVNRASVEGEKVAGVVAASYIPLNASTQTITAGLPAPICTKGTVIVEAGAIVADNAEVMTDVDGRAITFAAAAGKYAIGRVVNDSASTAAGQDLSVELYDIGTHL